MGNQQGKESRPPHSPSRSDLNDQSSAQGSRSEGAGSGSAQEQSFRNGRSIRPDLSLLGIGGNSDRDVSSLETRRETKQEREARKLEKERAARLKERERSIREEHVDGGYLVTHGVYVGTEDFNKSVVRQMMVCTPGGALERIVDTYQIDRKLAPFWRGLNDFSESWAEHQLMAAARGMPIPPADEVPPELEYRHASKAQPEAHPQPDKNIKNLTVPIGSRSQSYNSDSSTALSPGMPTFSLPSPSSPLAPPPGSSSLLSRTRAKTLASLTTSSRNNSQTDMTPRELQLPKDPFVNGQPIEVYLYKDAAECPICFLYYPPYLNTTRCCDQAICSECFVQIKRPEPHPPEHEQPDANGSQQPPPPSADAEPDGEEGQLVSEPSTCPFCKMPEFGVTYNPPPFRRGLTYGSGMGSIGRQASAMSSQSSVASTGMSPAPARRRGTSLSTTAPGVITTDRIRPDWATKLAAARAHQARRSAAATALHTAAYLMGNANREAAEARSFGPFSRRSRPRGDSGDSPGTSNAHLNALAFLAERHQQLQARQRAQSTGSNDGQPGVTIAPPRGSSNRRTRVEDLEEMMMMEAIRLSLASEEERRKKEEKEAKKEAKKKDKADRKAEKSARKNSLYNINSNSSTGLDSGESATGSGLLGRTESGSSLFAQNGTSGATNGKGKAIERETPNTSSATSPVKIPSPPGSSQDGLNIPDVYLSQSAGATGGGTNTSSFPAAATDPFKRSHLRQMSNASSSASSYVDPTGTSSGTEGMFPGSSTPPGAGDGAAENEPMFNFRSLAATLIDEADEEEKAADRGHHVEDVPEVEEKHHQPSKYISDMHPAVESVEGEGSSETKPEAAAEIAQQEHVEPVAQPSH